MSQQTINLARPYDASGQPSNVVWGGVPLAATPWQGAAYVTLVGAGTGATTPAGVLVPGSTGLLGTGVSDNGLQTGLLVDEIDRRNRQLGQVSLVAGADDEVSLLRDIRNGIALLLNEFSTEVNLNQFGELETL